MTEKRLPSPEEVRAFKEKFYAKQEAERIQREKEAQDQAVLKPEVLPAASWSSTDPSAMDRLIRAILKHESLESALAFTGCPEDVAEDLMSEPRFASRMKEIAGVRLLPQLAAMGPEFIKTAYGAKVFSEIFKGTSADDAEIQQVRSLKLGGSKARVKALYAIIKECGRQIEVLTGGHAPLPEEIEQIVRSVTTQETAVSAS